jgi:hypothetical protein
MPRKSDKSERSDTPRRKRGVRPQLPSAGTDSVPPTGGPRKRWVAAVVVVLLILSASAWYWPSSVSATATPAPAAPAKTSSGAFLHTAAAQPAQPAPVREARLHELTGQLEMADQTLCNYREGTKYPTSSRPIAEHPDQVYPYRPIQQTQPMHKAQGGTDASIQVQTSQSRVYLAAGESVAFTIGAADKDGKALPVFVTRAVAHGIAYQPSREAPQYALAFFDDGRNGDAEANDSIYTGVLIPAQTGFAQYNGTIRIDVAYNVGDRSGIVSFDVIYTPELPATWSGTIRDTVEDGTLVFHLKADVRMPGRYIATGRVDDANGKPFALASFNDVLQQGSNDIRLTVFGKLLRDQMPVMPLKLRDVEAYLLKENVDPDRALMPRMEGVAHVSKNYSLKGFSDAEWQSEERSRHLTEFGKDVDLAKKALVEFDPEQAQRPLPQSECSKKITMANKAS